MKTNQLDLLGKPNTINNFNIEGKLEELLSDFEASGRLLRIPKRIFIKGINGEIEGSIGLGKRVYNGGSLKFFRHYGHIYAGMSRSKLYNVDPGLLATLSKEGLLDEAIPEYNKRSYGNAKRFLKNRTSYSDEEIKKMIRAYDMYGSAREASKHVPFGRRTIAKYVKLDRRGIKRGNPKKPYETMEIRDLFYRFNGKAVLAAQNSKYCYMTIRKYWSEAGLLLEKYKRV